MRRALRGLMACCALVGFALFAAAGETPRFKVLSPISSGNLTVFPVVASVIHGGNEFITLDEGLRSGEVVVTEAGRARGLIRRHPDGPIPLDYGGGAQVNRLVLVNNSKRPLLLLAGEIVTGGKQDRVIGKDRLIPAHSDPVDLSVFCVEPGRWTERTAQFGSMGTQMAQPSVRARAMADKDQKAVWAEVGKSAHTAMEVAGAPAARELQGTTSYATVMSNDKVQRQVDQVAEPIRRNYDALIRDLRARKAVGVVVAVGSEIIWADVFASPDLLEKYWPKLVRSYAAEALAGRAKHHFAPGVSSAQAFLDDIDGRREVVESEPGVFRHAEITGDGWKAFELTSLLAKPAFDVHFAKMAQ